MSTNSCDVHKFLGYTFRTMTQVCTITETREEHEYLPTPMNHMAVMIKTILDNVIGGCLKNIYISILMVMFFSFFLSFFKIWVWLAEIYNSTIIPTVDWKPMLTLQKYICNFYCCFNCMEVSQKWHTNFFYIVFLNRNLRLPYFGTLHLIAYQLVCSFIMLKRYHLNVEMCLQNDLISTIIWWNHLNKLMTLRRNWFNVIFLTEFHL